MVRWQTCYAGARVRRRRGITTDEFQFVRKSTRFTPKVTMPSPSFLHFFCGPQFANPASYPDISLFWDDLRRRIDVASRFVPLERLAISPQCGFASTAGGNPLTPADQRAKLELVVKTAEAVWQEP